MRSSAMGRMARWTVLESISTRPSSENRLRPFRSGERVADGLGELALLADAREPSFQPDLEDLDDRPAALPRHASAFIGSLAADVGLHGMELGDALQASLAMGPPAASS